VLLKSSRLQEAAEVALRGWGMLRRLGLTDHRYACGLAGCAVEALFGLGRWLISPRWYRSAPPASQARRRPSAHDRGRMVRHVSAGNDRGSRRIG
jgi:hypothetical protein